MPKYTWTIAGVFTGLLILGFLGLHTWNQRVDLQETQRQLVETSNNAVNLQSHLNALEQFTAEQGATLTNLQTDLAARASVIATLQLEKEKAARAQQDLEKQMRSALESKDITISELQGKVTVNILDRVLFDSGEATLKPEGEQVLSKLAVILEQFPKRQVHVIGHTDNVPIRASARSRFPSNWELSTARATAAVRYLQEHASVNPQRLGAVGYGEFQPIADNATVEGRAKNRRIAVVVLPETFVPPETPFSPPEEGPANKPATETELKKPVEEGQETGAQE